MLALKLWHTSDNLSFPVRAEGGWWWQGSEASGLPQQSNWYFKFH